MWINALSSVSSVTRRSSSRVPSAAAVTQSAPPRTIPRKRSPSKDPPVIGKIESMPCGVAPISSVAAVVRRRRISGRAFIESSAFGNPSRAVHEWEIAEANTAARLRDWSPFPAVQLRYNLLDRSPERELLPMADAFDLPVFAWGPLAEGRLTGKYLSGHTGRVNKVGRPYTRVGSDDIVRDVLAISHEIGCSPAQVAISWVRQQPGSVIPLIAARTDDQFRDNLAATDVHLSQPHLARLDLLSRPPLGFPADVMREASVVGGVYGAQLPDIDDPRAEAVRRTTTGT